MKKKKQTRAEKSHGVFLVYKALKESGGFDKVPTCKDGSLNIGRKDGGLPTKPVVPCEDLSEADVLKECISWLIRHRVGAKRMNVGAGDLGGGNYRQYGIKGAADITCIYEGLRIEVECKKGKGGVLSLNQQKFRDWVQRYGGTYIIVHGVPELEFFMLSILQG